MPIEAVRPVDLRQAGSDDYFRHDEAKNIVQVSVRETKAQTYNDTSAEMLSTLEVSNGRTGADKLGNRDMRKRGKGESKNEHKEYEVEKEEKNFNGKQR